LKIIILHKDQGTNRLEKLSSMLLVLVHYSCLGGQKIGTDAEGYFLGGTSDESKHHLVEWDEVSSPIEN
jgi:hypothetical protein